MKRETNQKALSLQKLASLLNKHCQTVSRIYFLVI